MLALLVVLAGTSCGGGSSSIAPIGAPTTTNVALWVANGTNVLEILPTQSGVSDPAPHITLGRFGGAQGVQFDANGDLWVIDGGNGSNIGPARFAMCEASGLNPTARLKLAMALL